MGPHGVARSRWTSVLALHRVRQAGRARVRRGRRREPRRHRQGLLRPADDLRRRHERRWRSPARRSSARCCRVIPFKRRRGRRSRQGNATVYGLAAAVWTRTSPRRTRGAKAIRAGHGLGELLQRLRRGAAVRRLQGVGLRPRDRLGRPRHLHRGQDRLGRSSERSTADGHALAVRGSDSGTIWSWWAAATPTSRCSSAGPWRPSPGRASPSWWIGRSRSTPAWCPASWPASTRGTPSRSTSARWRCARGRAASSPRPPGSTPARGASSWKAGRRSPTTPCPSTWAPRWPGSALPRRPRARDPHPPHRRVRPPGGRDAGRAHALVTPRASSWSARARAASRWPSRSRRGSAASAPRASRCSCSRPARACCRATRRARRPASGARPRRAGSRSARACA